MNQTRFFRLGVAFVEEIGTGDIEKAKEIHDKIRDYVV